MLFITNKKPCELDFSELWRIANKAVTDEARTCDFAIGSRYFMLELTHNEVILCSVSSETVYEYPANQPDEYAAMQLLTKVFA